MKCDIERTLIPKLFENKKQTTYYRHILKKLYELHLCLFRRNSPKVMKEESREHHEHDEYDCSCTSKFFPYKNKEWPHDFENNCKYDRDLWKRNTDISSQSDRSFKVDDFSICWEKKENHEKESSEKVRIGHILNEKSKSIPIV